MALATTSWQEVLPPWSRWPARCGAYGSTFRTEPKEWYGVDGCIVEALNSLYFDLAMILLERGGPDRTGG